MTLKEELEILRGEPIQVFAGTPMDIPCIETSDPEKLCKNPVVSVHMITYNHEPYIRQAIEGVMMQKTDFEFELVIGEDASTDKTREICFEYQKRYSNKIRVLWWHENLYRNPHSAGGNAKRTTAHCRGEFIAFCEGDDYWIDPLKLQKQVDIMRKYPNVGLCFARGKISIEGKESDRFVWNENGTWKPGVISSREFMLKHTFGVKTYEGTWTTATFLMTASVLIRKSIMLKAYETYDIFKWRLNLGDTTLWLGLSSLSDAYYLAEDVSIYRQVSTGLCQQIGYKVGRDALIVRLFYYLTCYKKAIGQLPIGMLLSFYHNMLFTETDTRYTSSFRTYLKNICQSKIVKQIIFAKKVWPLTLLAWLINRFPRTMFGRYELYIIDRFNDPDWIKVEYKHLGLEYRNEKTCGFISRILTRLRK